jgi:RIO kinase 1
MRLPAVLSSLRDQGVIDEIIRPLKSGKEAEVYLVEAGGEIRVAKVYKNADQRSFKQRAAYTEGRRVRNTRDQRAMERRTRHGKSQEEAAWKSAEVDIIHRLHAQGVRVPTPHNFIDGVLIMELVRGDDGHPAPRLAELAFDPATARAFFDLLLAEVVKMLCAGIVHGDLSDYNVLVDPEGPVIIDFPQSVDAAQNRNAKQLLIRDVDNLGAFLQRFVPSARRRPYGQEIWSAYEKNILTPEMQLTGQVARDGRTTNMNALLDEIGDADRDELRRRAASGAGAPRPRRREVVMMPSRDRDARRPENRHRGGRRGGPPGHPADARRGGALTHGDARRGGGPGRHRDASPNGRDGGRAEGRPNGRSADRPREGAARAEAPSASLPSSDAATAGPPKRRRRRRRRRGGAGGGQHGGDSTRS